MSFKMKPNSGGGDFELAPAGSQPAVLIGLIELGQQENTFQGVSQGWQPKVFLVWELAEKKTDGTPFVVGRDYTASLGKKANLRAIVEKWRGKVLDDDEEYDLTRLLGQPCLLSLVHKISQNDKEYAKIDGVSALPKGMPKPKATRETLSWEIEAGKPIPAHEWIPFVYGKPLKDVIANSREMKEGVTVGAPAANQDADDTDAF